MGFLGTVNLSRSTQGSGIPIRLAEGDRANSHTWQGSFFLTVVLAGLL